MAATLTDAMKADLMIGNAKILLAPKASALSATTFTNADPIYTIKDSLAITENDPTKTQIQLDQNGGETVANAYENGEFVITGSCPSVAIEIFDYFYNAATTQPTMGEGIAIDGQLYDEGSAYTINKKIVNATMFLQSQSKKTALVFMNVELYAVLTWSSVNSAPTGLNFTATVLSGDATGDLIVLKAAA